MGEINSNCVYQKRYDIQLNNEKIHYSLVFGPKPTPVHHSSSKYPVNCDLQFECEETQRTDGQAKIVLEDNSELFNIMKGESISSPAGRCLLVKTDVHYKVSNILYFCNVRGYFSSEPQCGMVSRQKTHVPQIR